MFTKKNLMKDISDYIAECNGLGVHFNKVILFGSYAKNSAHKWSDIDLALVSDDFKDMWWDDRGKLSAANIKFFDIGPHILIPPFLRKATPLLKKLKKQVRK